MFFITYLWRELSRRMRQAVFIALGLALGVGLVVTVAATSAGVAKAQATVLGALYGVGTGVTVTGATSISRGSIAASRRRDGGQDAQIEMGPGGYELCDLSGTCKSAAGQTAALLFLPHLGFSASKVAEVARLPGVAAAAGGITLLESSLTFPESGDAAPQQAGYTIDGVDTAHTSLGPLSAASVTSGRSFTAAEADSDVAVVDSGYATSHGLRTGSAISLDQVMYTVIGIVSQPQGSNPPSIYVPLARAQAMSPRPSASMKNDVNTIYVAAASAAGIPAVQKEITGLLPGTTVTTASNLASQVTGSLTSAAKLTGDLGRWLSVLVLTAAFAVASLLTMAAVARRAGEFGTLKALGWRSRRIVAQVLGESVAVGIAGAAAGVGLGFAGAAIIAAAASKVSAIVGTNSFTPPGALPGARGYFVGGTALIHVVPVPLNPSVSTGMIALAVVLALAGGLLAGAFGSWRIARLRPADALARVA